MAAAIYRKIAMSLIVNSATYTERAATSFQLGASTTEWQVLGFSGGVTGQLVDKLVI
jgi:hypothetical protein